MPYTITEACNGCTACKRICPVEAIRGERKQQHVIHPDLCIECGACGRICASSAILNEKGELTTRVKQNLWPKPVWNYDQCVECRICVLICPTGSINLAFSQNGSSALKPSLPLLKYPHTCIACGFCEINCPTNAITMLVAESAVVTK